jgi:hypothetical protein
VRENGYEVELEVLITVKAYPQPSKTYGECVCVAAVRLDTETPEWCRLYPVDFRGLPRRQRFKKYDVVCLRARPRTKDPRPESFTPILETIEVVDHLGPEDGWAARRRYVEPLEVSSMCELLGLEREHGVSLGLFKPREIVDLHVKRVADEWDQGRRCVLAQQTLLGPAKRELEKIPYEFRFEYVCADEDCRGHKQMLIDWELGECWRNTAGRPEDERVRLVREKWLDTVCGPRRDPHFFVGNQQAHPQAFLVLGVYWPPRRSAKTPAPVLF